MKTIETKEDIEEAVASHFRHEDAVAEVMRQSLINCLLWGKSGVVIGKDGSVRPATFRQSKPWEPIKP